ncbi:DASH complex subunit Hsk3 like domain containing protein [Elaphomyces granulatus]
MPQPAAASQPPAFTSSTTITPTTTTTTTTTNKARQYAHLHAQLAQLQAHLADTENLLRMTAVQAGDMRFLGGYVGGMFMAASKVLGEEGVSAAGAGAGAGSGGDGARGIKKGNKGVDVEDEEGGEDDDDEEGEDGAE